MNLPVEVIEAVREGRCAIFVGSRFVSEAAELAGGTALDGRALAKALDWKPPRPLPGRARGPVTPVRTVRSSRGRSPRWACRIGRAAR